TTGAGAGELTEGRGVDYAFDAIGGEQTTLQILDAIRPGGVAVIVGMAAMSVRAPVTPYMMALQEKTLKGTMYGSVRPPIDFPRLVELYLEGRLKLDQLVSRTSTLDEINDGFKAPTSGEVARGPVVPNQGRANLLRQVDSALASPQSGSARTATFSVGRNPQRTILSALASWPGLSARTINSALASWPGLSARTINSALASWPGLSARTINS